jgi:hypothetical protein
MILTHLARIVSIIWNNGGRYWSLVYYFASAAILHKSTVVHIVEFFHPVGAWRITRMLFNMSPVWALLPITILLGVAFYREILKLDRRLGPRLALGVVPRGKCLVVMHDASESFPGLAKLLRLRVANPSATLIKGCRAYLVAVEQAAGGAGPAEAPSYGDSLPLRWSTREGEDHIDLPGGVPQYVNLLAASAADNRLRILRERVPSRYQDLFRAPGTYRLGVAVSGEGVPTETIEIAIEWPGVWDQLTLAEPATPEIARPGPRWRRLGRKAPA